MNSPSFKRRLNEIQGYNAELVGISVDSLLFASRAWAYHLHITIPLLSDFWPHGAVAQRYSVFQESDGVARAVSLCSFSMRRVSCVKNC